jgi:DNA helicase TIP49 (TBP-interacting protein)
MEAPRKLTYEELIKNYGPRNFDFETTKDLETFEGLIGQKRAESAINFGLGIKRSGYNIFIAGEEGLGKTSCAIDAARKKAET